MVRSMGPESARPVLFIISLHNFSDLCLRKFALSLLDTGSSYEKQDNDRVALIIKLELMWLAHNVTH